MISKLELVQMIWGIVCHDKYWTELNTQMLNSGEVLVEKSEQEFARKIAWLLSEIRPELVLSGEPTRLDIPALVLGGSLPKELGSEKITEKIEACRQYAKRLSNA